MSTVKVTVADSAYQSPTPTVTGNRWIPTSFQVPIETEALLARPGQSMVVARSGGPRQVWDGSDIRAWYVLVDAGTDSGMAAHPIAGPDRMDGGELQSLREFLGLTHDQLAARVVNAHGRAVNPRTLRDFEAGKSPVPASVRDQVEDLVADTDLIAVEVADRIIDGRLDEIQVWRSDEDFRAAHPQYRSWPARWWRQLVVRVVADLNSQGRKTPIRIVTGGAGE